MFYIFEENEDVLFHYGTPRHSGRYPWGSGKNPYQHGSGSKFLYDYRDIKARLKAEGKDPSDANIAHEMGMSSNEFRRLRTMYRNEEDAAKRARCIRLREDGLSRKEIHERTGIPLRSIDNYISESYGAKIAAREKIVNEVRAFADKNPYLDVGDGVASQLGLTETQFNAAVSTLCKEGYHVEKIYVEQATNSDKNTTMMVLVKDGVTTKDVWEHRDEIKAPLGVYFTDGGRSVEGIKPPVSIDSSRLMVNYAETGGDKKDGIIELRRGVADLSLGQNNYAQVRIAVDDSHYLKGMAMYADDLPPGVDIRFNTSKDSSVPMLGPKDNSVLKPLKGDEDNPFGSTIRQRNYTDADGVEHQSPINIVNDDSDWERWNKTLSKQVLSKQSAELAKKQLGMVYDQKKQQYTDICKIEIPAVKQVLLEDLADSCDSASVDLKAAALPRQTTQVLLPLSTIKDNEVYAPNFRNGEEIVLIRYPHSGPFEIPRLTVNNKNPEGRNLIGTDAKNAIGISANTAVKLSGADFDGDTVTAIPVSNIRFTSKPALEGLPEFTETFHTTYKGYEGMTPVGEDGFNRQNQMGRISNLIQDMYLQGAPDDELVRAVEQSMIVIDAEKHNLNWKQSEKDLCIQALKDKYQPKDDPSKPGGGASTLISRSKGEVWVNDRKDTHRIDPETGKKIYYEYPGFDKMSTKIRATTEVDGKTRVLKKDEDGSYYYTTGPKNAKEKITVDRSKVDLEIGGTTGTKTWVGKDKDGNYYYWDGEGDKRHREFIDKSAVSIKPDQHNKIKSTQMAETDDAFTLSSGSRMEAVYATHANKLKALANDARKETLTIKATPVNKEAAKVYEKEVASLKAKLDAVYANRPRERQAQAIASTIIEEKKKANPTMDESDEKKLRQRVISESRNRVGALSKNPNVEGNISIYIEDHEWEAIQSGAVPTTTLKSILNYSDKNRLRELALPKDSRGMTASKLARAKSLFARGYTQAEIADILGVSVSTLKKAGAF